MTEQCVERVFSEGSWRGHSCTRKATVERDGKWWCWQHDPEAVKTRAKERQAKDDAEWAATNERWARQKVEAERAKACVNFFHGRDIPTERIAEGGFNKMFWFVEHVANLPCDCGMYTKPPCPSCKACDLISKLGLEP